MTYSLRELLMSSLALLTLPLFFLAPGYVVASLTGLMRFREQGWIERMLWAVALSQPIALVLAVHPGLPLPLRFTSGLFLVLGLAMLALAWRDGRRDGPRGTFRWDRRATVVVMVAVLLVVYCVLGAAPVQWHGRLYESSIWQDWNVRIQLVNSAIRGGDNPRNPMFAPGGAPALLHYYYFWYVLCARMHDLIPVSARAIFTASCAGSALSLLAFFLLSVKYLGEPGRHLRRRCLALLVASSILGLDLVAGIVGLMHHRLYANLQFWLEDRSPRFLHVVLWSPHHAAGLVSAGLGTLLLVRCLDLPARKIVLHAGLAGLCFAASAGTSTFTAVLFSSALGFILVDALLRRQWRVVLAICGAAAVAVLVDAAFLHRLLSAPTASAMQQRDPRLLIPLPRFMDQALKIVWQVLWAVSPYIIGHHIRPHFGVATGHIKWGLAVLHRPVILALFFADLGFFAFVLFRQAREDFLLRRPMPRQARILWLIFLGVGIPGTRLTSAALQTNNDFARHAGMCMLFVLLLWAAPMIEEFWDRRRAARLVGQPLRLSWLTRMAVACAILGMAGQVVQILMDRVHSPLVDLTSVPRVVIAEHTPNFGFRFEQIREAMEAAARLTPGGGIVQIDPHSRFSPVFLLYTQRQSAASDDGCNTPFGGDPHACLPMTRGLIQLFGGTGGRYFADRMVFDKRIAFNPALVTLANFDRVCAADRLDALVADYTDPVWRDHASWVWQMTPAYANNTAKVFLCPASHGIDAGGSSPD